MTNVSIGQVKVMRSAAGFYIGRTCLDPDCGGAEVPYSRESEYFSTHWKALEWLCQREGIPYRRDDFGDEVGQLCKFCANPVDPGGRTVCCH